MCNCEETGNVPMTLAGQERALKAESEHASIVRRLKDHDYAEAGNDIARKESEVSVLLQDLDGEIEMLSMSANGFIGNVSEILSPERDEKEAGEDRASPLSPVGRRVQASIDRVKMVRNRINDANSRVRV